MAQSHRKTNKTTLILGAGITGLSAGWATKLPVLEATGIPGGICASYYMRPKETQRQTQTVKSEFAYRFEIGGGHWIFGNHPKILKFIHAFTPTKSYKRRSSVYFAKKNLFVPYPLQNNLRFFEKSTVKKALTQINASSSEHKTTTMKDWLENNFGRTLCELFFWPFHNLYTAGLYNQIAPQDAHKSPIDYSLVKQGANKETPPVGYNTTFLYPQAGLDCLARKIAQGCDMYYHKRLERIDPRRKELYFTDKSTLRYKTLISTLPLNQALKISGLTCSAKAHPYTSVLVLNIGAIKGQRCPPDHWLYIPDSASGFHRLGFYSNVDRSFLPRSGHRVSLYVERAFKGGQKPSGQEIKNYANLAIKELQAWKFIKNIEIIDTAWIDVAYTWAYPSSGWVEEAQLLLSQNNIYQIGRYGEWKFQGIADSIKNGLGCKSKTNNVAKI